MEAKLQKIPAGIIEGIEGFVHRGVKYLIIDGVRMEFHDAPGRVQRLIANIFRSDTKRRKMIEEMGITSFREAFDKWFYCVLGGLDFTPDIVKGKLIPDAYNNMCPKLDCKLRGKMCGNASGLKSEDVKTLQVLKEGHSIKEGADILFISVPGMKSRVENLKVKLNANNMANLIAKATELGV